jgi:hypothetical protein
LEPSFGGGDFLLPIIERLLSAWRAARPNGSPLDDLGDAIRAVELHHDTFRSTYAAVVALLKREGMSANTATALASRWLSQGTSCWHRWRANSILWWAILPMFDLS